MRYVKLACKLPFKIVVRKTAGRLKAFAGAFLMRIQDRQQPTYGSLPAGIAEEQLLLRFEAADLLGQEAKKTLLAVTNHYLKHRFDLLGSGWVQVRHGMCCHGLEGHVYDSGKRVPVDGIAEWLRTQINPSNKAYAQHVRSLITPDYVPIDWHIDFKSGYRWDECVWYKDIRFGHLLGVDVKVPWELARMQHLPQLARAHAMSVANSDGFHLPNIYVLEFQNQILDFIASNPPRYGVNWWCAMDVGIRIANWLMAYDLFVSDGAVFNEEFDSVFRLSVYQHGQHIVNNLEWHEELRNNHYLGNIVGLLFVAAYLPCSAEIDAWLAFAVQELIGEVKEQFYEDGGNFEASTSYHRLSAEMVVYATALVVGLLENKRNALVSYDHNFINRVPKLSRAPTKLFPIPGVDIQSPFPEWYWHSLEKMAEFTNSIVRPDGLCPQIGDNDSGRLFKLYPQYKLITVLDAKVMYLNLKNYITVRGDDTYWLEIQNDHKHLIAAANGFFERQDFTHDSEDLKSETSIVHCLARYIRVATRHATSIRTESIKSETRILNFSDDQNRKGEQSYVFAVPEGVLDQPDLTVDLLCDAYPQFGLYVYKSERLYLTVRCGPIGLNGLGAHAHNDPLAIELWIDGHPLIVDPGSYIYTPLPLRRNSFRSIGAHFSPHFNEVESGDLGLGVFALGNEAQAICVFFSNYQFFGCYQCSSGIIFRELTISQHAVSINDWSTHSEQRLCRLDFEYFNLKKSPYSDGYGWLRDCATNLYRYDNDC